MNNGNLSTALCIFVVGLFAVAIAATVVSAAPNAPTTLSVAGSSSRDLDTLPTQSANAQGGNVTEINIASIAVTKSWQGYYGNVTGIVTLQDGNNNTFYNWSMTSYSGRVFATRTNSITWSGVDCLSASNRTDEETYLGQTISDSDSVTNTYNLTAHPSFDVGSVTINAGDCFSTRGYVNNETQGANYVMVLLGTADGEPIYTALTNKSATGFNGKKYDFELLVGENQHTGQVGVTPYYFWTEFN